MSRIQVIRRCFNCGTPLQTDDPEEVKRLMLTPINDEITEREPYNGYLIYQGGVHEVDDFIKHVHK